MRPRLIALLVALGCVALLAGCGGSDSDSTSTASKSTSTGSAATGTGDEAGDATDVDWPYFGRVEERTHYIADAPDPPFHMLWEFFAKQLIEFPPVLQDGYVFVVNKTGDVYVVNVKTGKSEKSFNLGNDVTCLLYTSDAADE